MSKRSRRKSRFLIFRNRGAEDVISDCEEDDDDDDDLEIEEARAKVFPEPADKVIVVNGD